MRETISIYFLNKSLHSDSNNTLSNISLSLHKKTSQTSVNSYLPQLYFLQNENGPDVDAKDELLTASSEDREHETKPSGEGKM